MNNSNNPQLKPVLYSFMELSNSLHVPQHCLNIFQNKSLVLTNEGILSTEKMLQGFYFEMKAGSVDLKKTSLYFFSSP